MMHVSQDVGCCVVAWWVNTAPFFFSFFLCDLVLQHFCEVGGWWRSLFARLSITDGGTLRRLWGGLSMLPSLNSGAGTSSSSVV